MNPEESFIDEATISVRAGDGGDGCVSMRREKFVPRGGPNGGDGGRGGNVVITADRNLSTLYDQRLRRKVSAESGQKGDISNRTGRNGRDTEIRVPIGTIIYDLDPEAENEIVADLSEDGAKASWSPALGAVGGATPASGPRRGRPRTSQSRDNPASLATCASR